MIFYSVGKRVKEFVKVIINPSALQKRDEKSMNSNTRTEIHKFPNGEKKAELKYVNNELNGLSTFYFENGIIRAREHYKDGKLDGLSKKYYENGKLMSEEFYRNGKLLFKRVFSLDGAVTSETRF